MRAQPMLHAEIIANIPDLTEEDIRACLGYAAERERDVMFSFSQHETAAWASLEPQTGEEVKDALTRRHRITHHLRGKVRSFLLTAASDQGCLLVERTQTPASLASGHCGDMYKSSILQPVRSFQWSQIAHNNLGEFDSRLGSSWERRLKIANIFELGIFAGGGGAHLEGVEGGTGAVAEVLAIAGRGRVA